MEKIGILTDTTCDLNREILDQYNIKTVSLQVIYPNGTTFRDGLEINTKKIAQDLPTQRIKTSSPLAIDIYKAYEDMVQKGYTHIIASPLSSGLSGTFRSLNIIAKEFQDKAVIKVIDNKSVSLGFGYPLIQAAKARDEGKSFTEIVDLLNHYSHKIRVLFAVDDLTYLQRGGRISKTAEVLANMLDIKPIIAVNQDGQLVNTNKVRGIKKSMKYICKELLKESKDKEIEKVFIVHSLAPDKADFLKKTFNQLLDGKHKVEVTNLSSLLTVHTGPGLCGAGVFYRN